MLRPLRYLTLTLAWPVLAMAADTPVPAPAPAPEDVAFVADHDGSEQRFVLLPPPAFDPAKPVDILIALHGHGSDRWQYIRDPRAECRAAREVAAAHGMLFVSPDYRARTSWMGPAAEADMVQMIALLKSAFRCAASISPALRWAARRA